MFKIFDFGLHDRQNGREMAMGDGTILRSEVGYAGSNDDGEWKPLYASVSEEAMAAALAERGFKMVAIEDQDPEPEPDPDPVDPDPIDPDPVDPVDPVDPDPVDPTPTDDLAAALSAASGGDVLALAPGHYGDFSFEDKSYASFVTITAQDPANPPVFRSIDLNRVDRIIFDGIELDFTPKAGTDDNDAGIAASRSTGFKVLNSKVVGGRSLSEGEYVGRGIYTYEVDDVEIVHNEIANFRNATHNVICTGLDVKFNYIHDTRSTMVRGRDLHDVNVIGNRLEAAHPVNFGGSGDHGDYVHFWIQSRSFGRSRNVTVDGNFLNQADGAGILGIFLESSFDDLGYENFSVQNNVIANSNGTAIRVTGVDGVIANNTGVGTRETERRYEPRIRVEGDSENVDVFDNIMQVASVGDAIEAGRVTDVDSLIIDFAQRDDMFQNGSGSFSELEDFLTKGEAAGKGASLTSDMVSDLA